MEIWEHPQTTLKQLDIVITHPSTIEGCEDDMKKWPKVTYDSIFSYFVESLASDREAMNNLKSSEAYQYLHNKVRQVLVKIVDVYIYLNADIEPSQCPKSPHHHQAWVVTTETGEVQTAGCSCSHAAAVLWKVS